MSKVFVESRIFTKYIHEYMDDDEYSDFQAYLLANPHIGDVIPRGKGLRKIRWAGNGKGKRGGLRIIYFLRLKNEEIWLLTVYAKNECENLSDEDIKLMCKEVPND